jgi:hypothetical protein
VSGGWSLPTLLDNFHQTVEGELRRARATLGHPTEKGDASEEVWIEVLNNHLPARYRAIKAHVVDSTGTFSEQIDVVIHDRQYSPLIFELKKSQIVPAESVYAVFEAKQDATADHVHYAQAKVASVRKLQRTSVAVPTVDGVKPAKAPGPIIGGLLTLTCPWTSPLGDTMYGHLCKDLGNGRLDVGCVADAGLFLYNEAQKRHDLITAPKAATRFLFELIARLQELGTVAMIDVRAYAKHIR